VIFRATMVALTAPLDTVDMDEDHMGDPAPFPHEPRAWLQRDRRRGFGRAAAQALLDRLTHHCDIVETGNKAGGFASRSLQRSLRARSLAACPPCHAIPHVTSTLLNPAVQRGQNWAPIRGQFWKPIDTEHHGGDMGRATVLQAAIQGGRIGEFHGRGDVRSQCREYGNASKPTVEEPPA
jgi:hypothetical protein